MSTIKWSATTAHLSNAAPGTLVWGSPGSGKTFAMINMAANCLGIGQRVIVIDPKNDFSKLQNINPNIEVIDVKNITPGALNPFEFLKKYNKDGTVTHLSTSVLLTIVETMCGKLSNQTLIDITPILTDFVTKSKNSDEYYDMQDVADYLYANQSESAQSVGTMLKAYEDNQFGKLLFTREQNVKPLNLANNDSMVISLMDMPLPTFDKAVENYDPNERLISAIIYIITTKLLDILSQDNKIPTTLICDEAHLLFCNAKMSEVINKFLSLGRSLNVATILASQGISKFPKGIAQYITTTFMFKSTAMEEIRLFLDTFGAANDTNNTIDVDSIMAAVPKFESGVCFMLDRHGRNGIIKIKSNYDINLLTSNALNKKRDE